MNYENAGFFVHEPLEDPPVVININDDNEQSNNFTSPVGDCIYNKFTNEFLVSQNKDFGMGTASKVIRYDPDNNLVLDEIELKEPYNEVNYQNAKEMFIDANELLYIMVNTVVGDITSPNHPFILIYDATTYEFINSFELTAFTSDDVLNVSEYYMTHFCFSKSNNTTYFTVTPQNISLPPYNSEFNTMYYGGEYDTPNKGYLYNIANNQLVLETETAMINPGKILCPDDGNDATQSVFEGRLYILSHQLIAFNYLSKNMDFENKKLNDIVYSPYHDKLFALVDEDEDPDCNADRSSIVYEISLSNGYEFNQLGDENYAGQAASFFLNPYDDKIYLHTKFDNHKLGATPSQLVQFDVDPGSSTASIITIDLQNEGYQQNRSFYPELDHHPWFRYFTYNLTTPYIDPYQDKIYLPNGAHSNVSVVDFDASELLTLDSGTNWISIPRHMGNITNQQYDHWPTSSVFANSNFGTPYSELLLTYNNVDEAHEEEIRATFNIDDPGGWFYQEDMDQIFSYRGYKLDFEPENPNTLTLWGNVEDPTTPIDLYAAKHNWVGYFLYQEQDIFDALGLVTNYILQIKAEKWTCTYQGPFRNPGSPQIITEGWECNDEFHTIDYGEMVELTTEYNLPSGYSLVWQLNGQPVDGQLRDETEHFTYTETADYTPVYVLLDSTDNPSELATYVNDSCVGACIVLPGDTMVGILAYLDGQAADSITFEEWYNTKSTTSKKVNSYSVYNPDKEQYEQRSILLGENREYYKVSFRKHNYDSYDNNMQGILTDFWIYPNPSSQNVNIEYRLHCESLVNTEAYDIYGRRVAVIINSNQLSGVQKLTWNLNGNSGQRVRSGIYTIKIVAGGETVTRKVVVN